MSRLLRISLRWKIVLTVMLVGVLVIGAGAVQSYLSAEIEDRGNFLEKHFRRFDAYRKGLGRALGTAASFIAIDPDLSAGLSTGDDARTTAAFTRAIRALRATTDPALVVLVPRNGAPIDVPGATPLREAEIAGSRLVADVRGGMTIQAELAIVGGRLYQVSAAPVRDAEGETVGGVILGEALESYLRDYQLQSDANASKQHRLTVVDGHGGVLATVFPEARHAALADALREENWTDASQEEGDRRTKVISLDGEFDFYRAPARGYVGSGYGDLGSFFLLRTRDFKGDALQARIQEQVITFAVVGTIALLVGLLLSIAITRPLHRYIRATEDLAAGRGDLTKRLDESSGDELGKLAHNLNAVFGHIHDLAAKVQRASFQVGASSAEISAASKQMLEGAQEQARKTESSTAAVTELSASIQQVAENAMEATRVARSSGEAVQGAIDRMNEIRATVEEAAHRISDLGESGKRIGNIVEVIRQISDQTTLLALNAAIEAAHAGEQGRGFAVVADEVSQLATRVGQSARDIEDLIATIKEQTAEAVRAMSTGTREVEEGTKLVTSTLADLKKLVHVVEDTAKAVQEQALASDEIARNMDVVQRIAHDVLGSSEEAVTQGDHLHRLAHGLEQSVKGFRINASAAEVDERVSGASSVPPAALPPGGSGTEGRDGRGR